MPRRPGPSASRLASLQLPHLHGAALLRGDPGRPQRARERSASGCSRPRSNACARRSTRPPRTSPSGAGARTDTWPTTRPDAIPSSGPSLEELAASTIRIQENNLDTIVALAQRTFGAAYQFVPPMSVTLGMRECLGREEGPALQRHGVVEADGPARGPLRGADARVSDHPAAAPPGRAAHRHRGDRAPSRSPSTRSGSSSEPLASCGRRTARLPIGGSSAWVESAAASSSPSRAITTSAGTRAGRPGSLDVRDYCKLHIVAHYPAVLLGPLVRGPFHVVTRGQARTDDRAARARRRWQRREWTCGFVETALAVRPS